MSLPANVDLCQFPALKPPQGHVSEFVNPSQSLAPTLVTVSTLMAAWATLFVAGRVYTKRQSIDIADACAVVGLILDLALMALLFTTLRYMRHQWDVRACWFNGEYMKINFIAQLLMPLAFFFSKTAILLLLRQIFGVNRRMRIAIWAGIIICAIVYFQNLVLVPIFSVPWAGETWDDMVTSPRVFKMTPVGTEQGVLAVVLDIYIFLLPMPMLASLQLKSSKRLKLFGIFGTAFVGVVASIIGLAFRIRLLSTEDHTWANAQLYPAIFVELYVAVIVSCMPSFAQFLLFRPGSKKSDVEIHGNCSSRPSRWKPSWRRTDRRGAESSEENLAGFHGKDPLDTARHCYELKAVDGSIPVQGKVDSSRRGMHGNGGNHIGETGIVVIKSYHIENRYGQKPPRGEV